MDRLPESVFGDQRMACLGHVRIQPARAWVRRSVMAAKGQDNGAMSGMDWPGRVKSVFRPPSLGDL